MLASLEPTFLRGVTSFIASVFVYMAHMPKAFFPLLGGYGTLSSLVSKDPNSPVKGRYSILQVFGEQYIFGCL